MLKIGDFSKLSRVSIPFNIYHVSPCGTSKPDEFAIEVCYPVRKKGK